MGTTIATLPAPMIEESAQLMQAFCTDCAQRIHEYATIAERYGFADALALQTYLVAKPVVRRRIRELRAAWESDDNVEVRVRRLAGHTILEALPSTSAVMFDPSVNPSVRIDAMKAHARIAGLDVPPSAAAAAAQGAGTASRFSVQIVFGQAGKVETITTTDTPPPTIEGEVA